MCFQRCPRPWTEKNNTQFPSLNLSRSQLFDGTGNEVGNQNGVGAVSMNFSVCLPQFVTL